MGFGQLLNRNLSTITYTATDNATGANASWDIVVDKGLYADWDGRNYRGGMQVPAAWRCALLLSDLVGSLPWDAYRQRGGRSVERLDPTPPLLESPHPESTRMDTFSAWALDLIWEGNAVALVAERDYQGYPTAVLPVPARLVQARRVGTGANAGGLPIGQVQYTIGGKAFAPHDVLHIRGPHEPGDLRGMGVLENHLNGTLRLAADQADQAQQVSGHGVPTGILKSTNPDATEDDLKAMKTGWLKNQSQRTIQAINATTEFEPLSWNPTEMQMVEARRYTLHEIALIFGVPLSFLGVEQSNRTYTNTEQESLNLLKFGAPAGMLARFEQTLAQQFPRGIYVRANLDALLRPDTKTRYEAYALALDPVTGFMTRPEVRGLEDLPPEQDPAESGGRSAAIEQRVSKLKIGRGRALWDYWTGSEGLARWVDHLHPYTALTHALAFEGVPEHEVHGLAANIYHAVLGHWPGAHHGRHREEQV